MKLNPIKANMTELQLEDGTRVLFSYKTPIAFARPNGEEFVTRGGQLSNGQNILSRTTMKHINQWLQYGQVKTKDMEIVSASGFQGFKDQSVIDELVNGSKIK